MSPLWQQSGKDFGADWFFDFTAAEDRRYDHFLVPYDILSNQAQVRSLRKMGLISGDEEKELAGELSSLFGQWEAGKFGLTDADEDVHSAVEQYLTRQCGETGKKIHAGRSRNDLVLSDIRLYLKSELRLVMDQWLEMARLMQEKSEAYKGIFFPGYTHTQKAMPNSGDAWFCGLLENLLGGMEAAKHAYKNADACPLGSAAGYGVPYLQVDREFLARQLGFDRIQYAVTASQLQRGLTEQEIVDALGYVAQVYNRMAADIIAWNGRWVKLSDDQVSGSSIMPQKRNPDAWELIRGESHAYNSWSMQLRDLTANMTSGYHRDLQLVKKILMDALQHMQKLNGAVLHAMKGVAFDEEACREALTPDLFATHLANKMTLDGMPFREAYKKAGSDYKKEAVPDTEYLKKSYSHEGAPGRCEAGYFDSHLMVLDDWNKKEVKKWDKVRKSLIGS